MSRSGDPAWLRMCRLACLAVLLVLCAHARQHAAHAAHAAHAEHVRELEVAEGAPQGTRVGYIGDGEAAHSGPPYLIVPVPGSAVDSDLLIDQTTGEIRTRVPLDRETRSSYSLVAIPLSGDNVKVVVRVQDENDNAPTFPSPGMNIEFPENTPRDVKRTLNPARDLDLGSYNTQRYNIVSGNTDNAFRLSSHRERDGVLYLDLQINGFLDRETTSAYSLVIEALDGGSPPLRGRMTVNITIQDVNDNQPIFNQSSYSATIPENATVGTSVLRVFATDADAGGNGQIEYSINRRQSDRAEMFRIDPETGLIAVNKTLDFETKELHELVVVARDHGLQPLETTAFVSIRVTDVNDNQPTINVIFLSDDATPKISESAQPGEFVARISVNDPDSKAEYSNVNVTLSGGDGRFGLTTRDNIIYLVIVSLPLDRELQPAYTLSVVATDTGSPPLHASRTIRLQVTDVNDNAPEFSRSVYHASVPEVADPGTPVLRVHALDRDEGDNSALSYSLQEPAPWFTIDARSGLVSTRARVDCETEAAPKLTVVARDGGNPPLSSSATILVTIHDVNDNEPIFDQSFYNVSVPENEARGRCILKVSATDPDCGVNALVNYTLGEGFGKPGEFEVRSGSGEICIANDLDFETRNVYEFPVIATDRGGLSTTAMVKIQLTDVNDNRPVFYPREYNVSLREGGAGGGSSAMSPILAVAATDADSGRLGTITYRLVSGNDGGVFRIDRSTGELFVARPSALSSRSQPLHRLNVSATDGGGLRAESDAEVFVSVVDSAQRPPIFERPRYHYKVREDVKKGTLVGAVKATSVDTNDRQVVKYSIYSGDPEGFFTIDPESGAIRTASGLDHEQRPSILLNIQASSGNPPAYGHTQVNIAVEDVNDNSPEFESPTVRISVAENLELGTPLYAAHARDRDGGSNGLVRYRIAGASSNTGPFAVDPNLGYITLTRHLDYEAAQRHALTVIAYDGGKPSFSANLTLLLDVQDVNDNPPVFERPEYAVSILESAPLDSLVVQVTAVDLDTGNNARLTYRLEDTPTPTPFAMESHSGRITLRGSLDRERLAGYSLLITAVDHGTPPASATARLSVTVLDANDNDPHFEAPSYEFEVEENLPRGARVGALSATDADIGENAAIRYSLIPANTSFHIDPITGVIMTKEPLDRETRAQHEVVAEARDSGAPSRAARVRVRVAVGDVNDNAPELVDPREDVVSAREEQPPGTEVARVRAVDRDRGANASVTYSVLKGRDSDGYGVFTIDPISGVIRTRVVLDHEERAIYRLAVAATDSGKPPKQTVRLLRVEVLDLNDNRPTFTSSSLVFSIREDVKVGHIVGSIACTEQSDQENLVNGNLNRHVTYTLITLGGEHMSGAFDIDRSTGSLVVARQLDRESQGEYRLEVRALDTSATNNPQSSAVTIKVDVVDVNDNPPKWLIDPITVQIPEDTKIGAMIYNFTATDADSGLNGEIHYSLATQSPNISPVFAVDPLRGTLTLLEPLDYENITEYTLIVKATDQAANVSERLSTAATVRVIISDANDNSPVFVAPTVKVVKISDSVTVGTSLCRVIAVDADSGDNGRVSYVISSGNDNGRFIIGYESGVITLSRPLLSFDGNGMNGRFSLNITASDHGAPNARQSHGVVHLAVQGSADNPPRFLEPVYRVNISEDLPVGSFVIKVAAKPSLNNIGNLTYSIPRGVADDKFTIDSAGVVRLRGSLDREKKDSYLVPLQASHGPRHDSAVLRVTVADANDHAPAFVPGACYPLSVPENSEFAVIHKMVANDPDSGPNGDITYSITGGNVGNLFSIESRSGALSARPLDRESRARHWLVITAQDGGSPPRHGSCNISLTVEDLNDNAPHFSAPAYAASVPEDAPADTSVLTVKATDPDLGVNARVLYSLANESQWLFRVDNRTGVITTAGVFDRESQSVYDFLVVATDGGRYDAKSQSVPVQITIGDVNDNKPMFTEYPFTGQIAALSQPGQSLLRVTATDADDGTNAEIVYHLINEPHNSKFRLNPNTGVLTATQSLASENGRLIHLEVLARDKGNPPQNATGLIEIRVGDVPEGTASLHFQNSTYSVSLMENARHGKEILQVSAVRSDGRRQRIVYSFGSGNEESTFDIDPDTGIIRVGNSEGLDHEQPPGPRRRLVVVARAEGSPVLYGYCEVWIQLKDRNDNPPRFTQQQYTANVWEGNSKGTFVMQLSAKDADDGANARVLYHIVDGNHDNAFIIEPAFSGSVKTNIVLDREIRDMYRLTVIATDGGDPQLTGSATLRVHVVDVNDNQPTFPPRPPVYIHEGTPVGTVVTTVAANDVDTNPALTYTLLETGGPPGSSGVFSVDRFSGRVVLQKPLDHELMKEYSLGVAASDAAHVAKTTLQLRVTDDNDNAPEFQQPAYSAIIPEGDTGSEIEILRVNATDADSDDNAHITYRLLGTTAGKAVQGVRVDASTGAILANRSALTAPADLQLVVEAADGGKPQLKSVAALRLQVAAPGNSKPHFTKDDYRISLPENTPKGKTFLRIGTVQTEFNKNEVDFMIYSGNDDSVFEVANPDGALILVKSLDREVKDSYLLRISAVERGRPHAVDESAPSISVHINVEDSNDNAPVFNSGDYEYTISEGTPVGNSIVQIKATDADMPGTSNSHITYDITSGNDEGLFKIDKNSGLVSVNSSLEFDDGVSEYFLVLRACDNGIPALCTLNNLQITLTDENDNAPRFPVSEYFEFVGENEPVGTTVFTARATDLDKGVFGSLNYSIVSSASNGYNSDESWKLFRIDPLTGQVNTNAIFDYESRNRYAFTLKASDAGGKTASVRVRIEIESRDEFHPQFTERTYRFTLATPKAGALPIGYIVGHVTATDRDKGADGRVVYQLTTQHPYFKMNRTTGAVIIKKKLENAASTLESGRDISLVVTASSGRQGSLTNMTVVEIVLDPLADPNTNLVSGSSNKTAVAVTAGGLADWALGLLIALILVVASFGAIFLFLHMRNRRHKKINKPGLNSDAVGSSNSYVDPSAFDTIPIRGGSTVSGAGGQFAPPKYDEIPPYGPHTASSNSGAATTSELSGSEQSGSSGRGSAEDGEDGEDEEIRMINEGPLQRDSGIHRQTDDVDDDNLSDVSVHNTQEYLARLGIVDTATTGGASTSSRRCSESVGVGSAKEAMMHHAGVPLDPLHMFDEDAANENDITNLIYAKLNDVAGSDRGSSTGEVGAAVERAMVLGAFGVPSGDPSVAPTQGPSMNGSLSSIVHSEEELTGSYNWDYLLDWGPQYQPLAHVFSEIARLKDDTASVQSGNSGTSSAKSKPPHVLGKGAPPPLLTSVAPRSIPAPALSSRTGALLLPRSPISHDTTPGGFSTSAAMSPSFSPSLSPLATRSPSISPRVPPGLHHTRGHKPHHNLQDTTLRI